MVSLLEQYYKKIHFIITTTDEDMEKNSYIYQICERLPLNKVIISAFDQSRYFFEIIEALFEVNNLDANSIESLFCYCQGSPQSLIDAIRSFYCKEYITLLPDKERALLDILRIEEALLQQSHHFQLSDYTFRERLVLIVLQQIDMPIQKELAIELIHFIASNRLKLQFSPFSRNDINEVLFKFIDTSILIIDIDGIIRFKHDSLMIQIQQEVNNESSIHNYLPLLSNDIVNFMKNHNLSELYSRVNTFHSYQAKLYDWQHKVFNYLSECITKGYLSDAINLADRIDIDTVLDQNVFFILAKCFYENGQYKKSKRCLQRCFYTEVKLCDKYELCLLSAKIYNMLQNKEEAYCFSVQAIDIAKACEDEEGEIEASALQFYILVEMNLGERRQQAIDMFSLIEDRYKSKELEQMPRALGKLFRFSCDQYSDDRAIHLLNISRDIAYRYGDCVEFAFATGNLGFAHYRKGELERAKAYITDAIDILKNIQNHEVSYAKNNLAVIAMREGKFDVAIELLKEAQYINQSLYASLAISTNLLIAVVTKGQQDDIERLFHKLSKEQHFIPNSSVAIRKINNAFAYASFSLEHIPIEEIIKYAETAQYIGKGTSSERISNNIIRALRKKDFDGENNICEAYKDYWLLTYSH